MKWRKVKKRFKKRDLPRMIGMNVFEPTTNTLLVITNVRISPAGRNRVDYNFTAENPKEHRIS